MSILDLNFDEIPDQYNVTDGTYKFVVKKFSSKTINTKNGPTDVLTVTVDPVEAIEADLPGPLELAKPVYMEFWESSASETNPARSYKRFVQNTLGVSDGNVRVALDNAIGREFVGVVKTKMTGKDKDIPTPYIVKVTAV